MARRDNHIDNAPRLRTAPNAIAPPLRHQYEQSMQELREALRHSNERMTNMLESITDGFATIDRLWRISYINSCAETMLSPERRPREPLLGHELWQAFPELLGTVCEAQLRVALERQEMVGFELYYLPRRRWLEVRAYPSREGLTVYLQDISQRKADERALRESANGLQVALAAGKLGDWRWDAGSDRVTLGRRAAELLGLSAAVPLTLAALREQLMAADREPARRAFLRAFARHSDFNIECRLQRARGAPAWLSVVGHGNYGDDGVLLGMTGMVQDISARKEAEDSLRRSEEELRALANSIPQLAWIAAVDGAMLWYNQRWYDYTGSTPQQPAARGELEVYDPDCLPQMKTRWEASLRSGQPFEMEFPIRGADGQYRWFLTRANPVRDGAGQLLRWFGTSTDVDQVKRVQEALRDERGVLELLNSTGSTLASTRELPSLLQEVCDAATLLSGARYGAFFYQGVLAAPNAPAPCALTGLARGAFDGAPQAGTLAARDGRSARIVRCDDALRDERHRDNVLQQALPEGTVRSYLALPVVARSGEVLGSLHFGHPEPAMFSERSERLVGGIAAQAAVAIDNARLYEAAQQAAEERARLLDSERGARAEAERTSQMKDEFLATLSHELRTPLTAILGWAQVLRRGSRDQADLVRGLQTIERNARAQAQLIEDLLDMNRISSGKVLLDMHTVSPQTIIEAAIETVRPAAEAKHIELSKEFEPGAGMVAADPSRLQQIIWNLLSNAIKFTPRDGAVRIALRRADDQLEIEISDNGIGIQPEFLAHVFERFRQGDASTTRKHGGLGLGLSIVKHLVEQHGGTVGAASAGEGHGARFTVRLPPSEGGGDPPPAAHTAPAPAQSNDMSLRDLSGLRVLVVDDEADARELIKRILNDCNADVLTAASAGEALALLTEHRPDLLVSDIGMPGMDGFELLERVRALGPQRGGALPAIALTAFARSEDRIKALSCGFRSHIAKPLDPSDLIAKVAAIRVAHDSA